MTQTGLVNHELGEGTIAHDVHAQADAVNDDALRATQLGASVRKSIHFTIARRTLSKRFNRKRQGYSILGT